MGITVGALRDWRGTEVTCDDVRRLTEDEAKAIFRARYIKPFADVAAPMRPQVIDIAVNSGVGTAKILLSRARQSLAPKPLGTRLVIERLRYLARIVKNNPSQRVFLEGWIDRAVEFL